MLGLGAFATGIGGIVTLVHEFRRRDRRALNDEGREMSNDLAAVRHDLVECRRYAYSLGALLARYGHDFPDPPELKR